MGEADDMGPPHIIQRNDKGDMIWLERDDMTIIISRKQNNLTNYATSAIKSSNKYFNIINNKNKNVIW